MRGRLPVMLMALVALAMVLSLATTLAPGAIAQDSGAAPDGAAKWGRYRMPSAQQIEAAKTSGILGGVAQVCAIMTSFGCTPQPSPGVSLSGTSAAATSTSMPTESPRWYCPDNPE